MGLEFAPGPEPRSKQWILQRLVDAGALPLQEPDKFGFFGSGLYGSLRIGSFSLAARGYPQTKQHVNRNDWH